MCHNTDIQDFVRSYFSSFCTEILSERVPDLSHLGPIWLVILQVWPLWVYVWHPCSTTCYLCICHWLFLHGVILCSQLKVVVKHNLVIPYLTFLSVPTLMSKWCICVHCVINPSLNLKGIIPNRFIPLILDNRKNPL